MSVCWEPIPGLVCEAERGMEPLRVTACLRSGIVTADGLVALDGLLAWAAYCELPEAERAALPDPNHVEEPADIPVPLARWTAGPERGWCASDPVVDWLAYSTAPVRQRTPIEALVRYSADDTKINLAGGRYKSYDLPMPQRLAECVAWYTYGHRGEIMRMLVRWIHRIGRKHNHGHGDVGGWRVEPVDEDWSITRDGALMRPVPRHLDAPGVPSVRALRPPYWHRNRRREVWAPC